MVKYDEVDKIYLQAEKAYTCFLKKYKKFKDIYN